MVGSCRTRPPPFACMVRIGAAERMSVGSAISIEVLGIHQKIMEISALMLMWIRGSLCT